MCVSPEQKCPPERGRKPVSPNSSILDTFFTLICMLQTWYLNAHSSDDAYARTKKDMGSRHSVKGVTSVVPKNGLHKKLERGCLGS